MKQPSAPSAGALAADAPQSRGLRGRTLLHGLSLVVAIVMGVIIAIGSLLAVRANLHEYAAKGVAVPAYVRVQFTNFLLGSLGAAALTLFGSITAMSERSRERAG